MKKVLRGTSKRPRLYVFRSNKHIYAQIIDDTDNRILTSKSSLSSYNKDKSFSRANCQIAQSVGTLIAQDCIKKGIHQVIFDRGNKLYHGRIKALAESARKEGIEF